MATSLECSTTEQTGVVLRVKRKRTDDAVEALVVSHIIPSKKPYLSSDDEKKKDENVTNEVFRLLGTCNEIGDSKSKDLLKNVTKTKMKSHDNAKTNFKGIKEQTKKKQTKLEIKKKLNSDARFHIISRLRQDGSSDDAKSTQNVDSQLQRTISSDSSADSADDEVKRLFTVYDLVRDDVHDSKRSRDHKSEDPNTILCNSVKMIREKLVVSEADKPDIVENYVYDYYYATKSNEELGDVLEITCFDDDDEFYLETADKEFEEAFEDDDDSNDENNWRNDYPDEGAWSSEEDTKPQRMKRADFGFSYGMDDDDDIKYDKRAFEEDLTSDDDDDDELNDYGQPYSLSSRKEDYKEELSDDPDLNGL